MAKRACLQQHMLKKCNFVHTFEIHDLSKKKKKKKKKKGKIMTLIEFFLVAALSLSFCNVALAADETVFVRSGGLSSAPCGSTTSNACATLELAAASVTAGSDSVIDIGEGTFSLASGVTFDNGCVFKISKKKKKKKKAGFVCLTTVDNVKVAKLMCVVLQRTKQL